MQRSKISPWAPAPCQFAVAAAALAIAGLLLFGAPAVVRAEPPAFGVNVVNPHRLPVDEQQAIIAELTQSGVDLIRAPLELTWPGQTSLDPAIDFVIRAHQAGIRTDLIVGLAYPPGSPKRAKSAEFPYAWPLPPLTAADPDLLRQRLSHALARLEAAGVVLAGLEVGNEINWTGFNGSFEVPGTGRIYGYEDLYTDPEGMRIAAGLRVYIESLRVVRALRDASRLNRDTPIVSAGLADPGPPRLTSKLPLDGISIDATLRYLRDHGLDGLVDAYGVHTYPGRAPLSEKRLEQIADSAFGQCGAPPAGKPCWLTEWGVKVEEVSCADDDAPRLEAIARSTGLFERLMAEGVLAQVYYYQWDGDGDAYGLYRCGRLTSGGRIVLP